MGSKERLLGFEWAITTYAVLEGAAPEFGVGA
jgi:hypothetical protein